MFTYDDRHGDPFGFDKPPVSPARDFAESTRRHSPLAKGGEISTMFGRREPDITQALPREGYTTEEIVKAWMRSMAVTAPFDNALMDVDRLAKEAMAHFIGYEWSDTLAQNAERWAEEVLANLAEAAGVMQRTPQNSPQEPLSGPLSGVRSFEGDGTDAAPNEPQSQPEEPEQPSGDPPSEEGRDYGDEATLDRHVAETATDFEEWSSRVEGGGGEDPRPFRAPVPAPDAPPSIDDFPTPSFADLMLGRYALESQYGEPAEEWEARTVRRANWMVEGLELAAPTDVRFPKIDWSAPIDKIIDTIDKNDFLNGIHDAFNRWLDQNWPKIRDGLIKAEVVTEKVASNQIVQMFISYGLSYFIGAAAPAVVNGVVQGLTGERVDRFIERITEDKISKLVNRDVVPVVVKRKEYAGTGADSYDPESYAYTAAGMGPHTPARTIRSVLNRWQERVQDGLGRAVVASDVPTDMLARSVSLRLVSEFEEMGQEAADEMAQRFVDAFALELPDEEPELPELPVRPIVNADTMEPDFEGFDSPGNRDLWYDPNFHDLQAELERRTVRALGAPPSLLGERAVLTGGEAAAQAEAQRQGIVQWMVQELTNNNAAYVSDKGTVFKDAQSAYDAVNTLSLAQAALKQFMLYPQDNDYSGVTKTLGDYAMEAAEQWAAVSAPKEEPISPEAKPPDAESPPPAAGEQSPLDNKQAEQQAQQQPQQPAPPPA